MVPMKDFFAEQSEKGTMKMFFDLMGTPPNLDEIRFVWGAMGVVDSQFLSIVLIPCPFTHPSFLQKPHLSYREELTLVQPDTKHITNLWNHIRPLQEKIEATLLGQTGGGAEEAAMKKECDIVYNVGFGLMLPPK